MKIRNTLELIKFSHSIFALPFALAAMVVATPGFPGWRLFGLILLAMVSARSGAMAFNRLVDADMDAKNPRTFNRHIPKGILSKNFVCFFTILSLLVFFGTCYVINSLAFKLSPIALFIILGYSYSKRFTWFSHFWLGVSLGIAPMAVCVAVQETIIISALWLCLGVVFWTAGLDILYSTQDYAFDREHGIQSIPARFGIFTAIWISRACHSLSWFLLIQFGNTSHLFPYYWGILLFVAAALIWEHRLVNPNDFSKINAAFFNANGVISVGFLVGIVLIYL